MRYFAVRISACLALSTLIAGCAEVSVKPKPIQPPNPALASAAIEAEPTPPTQLVLRDFEFAPQSVHENSSPLNRATDLLRSSSAEDRRVAIGREAAASISEVAVKRLGEMDLVATRIVADSDIALSNNILLVTGRLLDVDEGNRFTRVALGLGFGEARLDTEVHVYRLVHGEKAEVLAFTTHADSGKMVGVAPSMGLGELFLAPVSAISTAEDAASTGQTIYTTQMKYLGGETGDQVARYLSQYSAAEGWIPAREAAPVNYRHGVASIEDVHIWPFRG